MLSAEFARVVKRVGAKMLLAATVILLCFRTILRSSIVLCDSASLAGTHVIDRVTANFPNSYREADDPAVLNGRCFPRDKRIDEAMP